MSCSEIELEMRLSFSKSHSLDEKEAAAKDGAEAAACRGAALVE